MLNRIILMGRLTRDPELRHTQSGAAVASFTLAVDRDFKSRDGGDRATDFIDIVAWRNTAEFICRYFQKGQRIALQGSLQARSYTDKDGNRRTAYEVVVDNAFFAESKGGASGAPRMNDSQIPTYSEAAPAFSTAAAGDFEEIVGDDDLPF